MEWFTQFDPTGEITLMLITVALGSFVGLRREIDLQEQGVPGFVGFRTMPLITLLGTLSTFFPLFPYLPVIGFVAIMIFLAIAYYNGVFQLRLLGLTSEVSTLIMYMVGVLVGYGHLMQAIVITVFIAAFTAFKPQMHRFVKTVSPEEWVGSLQLLIISAIVLPVLPRTAVDPWGVIIPYEIWLVVILISAIGFVGYFLNKYVGKKGSVLLTSLVGSFVSSTIVSTHLAIQSKADRKGKYTDLFIFGIIISIATMLARVGFVMAILTPIEYLLQVLAVPASMFVATVICGLYWYGRSQDEMRAISNSSPIEGLNLKSPFQLIPAFQFAALFIVVLLGVQLGKIYLGSYGVIATTFFSAFADVDAAIVSVLQSLRLEVLDFSLVMIVVTIALVINTLVKALYVYLISRNNTFSLQVLIITVVASLAGVVAFAVF